MNPANPNHRHDVSADEQIAALQVAAKVLQAHWPKAHIYCSVFIGPNKLDAYASMQWPGVVRVTLRHGGELVAQSMPGQPLTVDAAACAGQHGRAMSGGVQPQSFEPVAEFTRTWDAMGQAFDNLDKLLLELRAELQTLPNSGRAQEFVASLENCASLAMDGACDAVHVLRHLVDPRRPEWACLRLPAASGVAVQRTPIARRPRGGPQAVHVVDALQDWVTRISEQVD